MKLVDKKNLIKSLEQEAHPMAGVVGLSLDSMLSIVEGCPVSPAQLAEENLKAWAVLEELKNWMASELSSNRVTWPAWEDFYRGIRATQKALKRLESQAPSSELVREIRENREKARAWDAHYAFYLGVEGEVRGGVCSRMKAYLQARMRNHELLAESKTPPTAEEEPDEP